MSKLILSFQLVASVSLSCSCSSVLARLSYITPLLSPMLSSSLLFLSCFPQVLSSFSPRFLKFSPLSLLDSASALLFLSCIPHVLSSVSPVVRGMSFPFWFLRSGSSEVVPQKWFPKSCHPGCACLQVHDIYFDLIHIYVI